MDKRVLLFFICSVFLITTVFFIGLGAEEYDPWGQPETEVETGEQEDPLVAEYAEKINKLEEATDAVQSAEDTDDKLTATKQLVVQLAELQIDELTERKEDLQLPIYYEPEESTEDYHDPYEDDVEFEEWDDQQWEGEEW